MDKSYISIIEPIVFTASRLEVIANRYLFGPLEMTISSVKILRLLERKTKLTATEILEEIGGTKSNISQRLELLEKRGYIKKCHEKIQADKRKVSIELTQAGRKKLLKLYQHIKKTKLELEANFSKREIAQHYAFFKKLNELIEIKEEDFARCKCKNIFKNLSL